MKGWIAITLEYFAEIYLFSIEPVYYIAAGALALMIGWLGRRGGTRQSVCRGMLGGYLFLVYSSTVFTRGVVSKNIELMPFWSYREIFLYHNSILLTEDILNVVMTIPVGALFPLSFPRCRLRTTVLAVLLIELSVEALQFVTRRGLAEWDDVFHGVVGGILGYCMCCGLRSILSRISGIWKLT